MFIWLLKFFLNETIFYSMKFLITYGFRTLKKGKVRGMVMMRRDSGWRSWRRSVVRWGFWSQIPDTWRAVPQTTRKSKSWRSCWEKQAWKVRLRTLVFVCHCCLFRLHNAVGINGNHLFSLIIEFVFFYSCFFFGCVNFSFMFVSSFFFFFFVGRRRRVFFWIISKWQKIYLLYCSWHSDIVTLISNLCVRFFTTVVCSALSENIFWTVGRPSMKKVEEVRLMKEAAELDTQNILKTEGMRKLSENLSYLSLTRYST